MIAGESRLVPPNGMRRFKYCVQIRHGGERGHPRPVLLDFVVTASVKLPRTVDVAEISQRQLAKIEGPDGARDLILPNDLRRSCECLARRRRIPHGGACGRVHIGKRIDPRCRRQDGACHRRCRRYRQRRRDRNRHERYPSLLALRRATPLRGAGRPARTLLCAADFPPGSWPPGADVALRRCPSSGEPAARRERPGAQAVVEECRPNQLMAGKAVSRNRTAKVKSRRAQAYSSR